MNTSLKSFVLTGILSLAGAPAFAETIIVSVPEMECGNCSRAIETRLKQQKEVTAVSSDTTKREVTITTDDSTKFSDEEIKALIQDAGFDAGEVKRAEKK
jgi:copper chaperone CopZ